MTEATHADFEEEWARRASDTRPADRAAAEAAARRFYDSVGFLGGMQAVLWANSFPEFARMVSCMDRGLGWHVLYSFLKRSEFVDPDPAGFGVALADAMGAFGIMAAEYREADDEEQGDEDGDDEDEERDEDDSEYITVGVSMKALIPHIYAPKRLAHFQDRIASGELPPTGMQNAMLDVLRQCPAFFPLPGIAILCDNPARITPFGIPVAGGRAPGLAFEFRSGRAERFWNGIRVQEPVARKLARPDLLACSEILEDFAPEIRALLIAEAGAGTIARGAGAGAVLRVDDTELLHRLVEAYGPKDLIFDSDVLPKTVKDDFGTLFRVEVPGDEDICVVKVLNATPEPDGTFKDYYLRVPPRVQSAREAVAWTFDMEEGYAPFAQT